MKAYNRERIKEILDELDAILESEDIPLMDCPRIGDAGTPLSIEKVIDDEEHRTVVIVWGDGTSTKAVANPVDEYDFMVGFGLCISKKFVKNLARYAEALHNSSRCIHVKKKDAESSKKSKK